MNKEDIQLILEAIIILIGLYLAFFKSYFQEKGKNLATSEDIEKITRKVENVKKELAEDLALSKSKIDILYNLKLNQLNNKREALLCFHKVFSSWFNKLTNPVNLVNDTDNIEINQKIKEYYDFYESVLNEYNHLEVFCEDDDFLQIISQLKINLLKQLSQNPINFLVNLKHNNEKKSDIDKLPETQEKYEVFRKLLDEKRDNIDEFNRNNINGLKKVISDYNNYVIELRKQLEK